MGSVIEPGRCHRCERLIEADSPSDSLCVACYEDGYMAMLERIRTDGAVRVVAFYDPSRIARDNLLSAEFYALMEQHGRSTAGERCSGY